MKEILKNIILENQRRKLPEIISRNFSIDLNTSLIISLIGARRSGKTYILYQTIQKLLNDGIAVEKILFINFEDERLDLKQETLDLILQAFIEIYPNINLENCFLFFDEIQNIPGWEKFVRRIFDNYSKHIFVTGSNAKLLSTEIADALRGRTLSYTIYPLSFKEYLSFKKIKKQPVLPNEKALILNAANDFIHFGGFPEIIEFIPDTQLRVLQSYFNTMIYRDIVERYKITDTLILKYFIKKVFANITKPLSINKIYNDLRSQGYKISNNYLYDFENYMNTVFLSVPAPKFYFSEIKQLKSDKKIYAIDTGLLASIEFSISENNGKLLENAVFLELVKAGHEVFYYKNRYECDFISKNKNELQAIQVCWNVSDNTTKTREIRGIVEACREVQLKTALIITFDQKEEIITEGINIQIIPFYLWASQL